MKDGAIENKSVEFAVFTAGVGAGWKIAEEGSVKFAAGEAGVKDFRIDTRGDCTEVLLMEVADEFARVALPNGEEAGHADAGEIFLAVGAEVFEEDVAEGYFPNTLVVEEAESFFHASFVDSVDTLGWNEDFVERQADGLSLLLQEFAADAVHSDAVVGFGDGGEKSYDLELLLQEQRVQSYSAVFAAAPAEEDGFG